MSDTYLLAASLLTGGPMSAWTLPALPLMQPDNLLPLWDVTEAQPFQSVVTQNIVSIVDVTSPEFSQQELRPQDNSSQTTSSKVEGKNRYYKPNERKLASGSQLYFQRLAALEAGQIYTRLPFDSFKSSWKKTNRKPTYEQWKSLLAQEARSVAIGQGSNRLSILVGDSLSLWFPSEQLPSGQFWLNQGISGDNTTGILKRLSAFAQTRPDTIYLMAGINDLRQGATDRTILNNHRQIIRRLRQAHPQAKIIVKSILPTRIAGIPNKRIGQLNQQLAAIAQQEGANFLNIQTLFADFEGSLRRDLTTDGLHLNQRGYEVWQWGLRQTEFRIAQR